jgi:hypothetical protein
VSFASALQNAIQAAKDLFPIRTSVNLIASKFTVDFILIDFQSFSIKIQEAV